MKIIEIIVSTTGETTIETRGFAGRECLEASRHLETMLGAKHSEQLTSEFYAVAGQHSEYRLPTRGEEK